ncbi:MAG: histone deacetylase [Actinobacteria bacterium]|nr:histone deacetylase [Actinomycetota bacterium]
MYFIYDDFFLKHENGPSHPENPDRLVHIIDTLKGWQYRDCIDIVSPLEADEEQITMVHTEEYISMIRELSSKGGLSFLDMDTGVNKYTYRSALLGAGGCFKGLDLIFGSKPRFNKFFLAARPPGHHAFPSRGSGFCIFNSIALGAKYAQKKYGVGKIAIIDFDAHHGNGTQDIFYGDDSVLYISFHQYPHYPGTGDLDEIGRDSGKGFNLNFPFIPGTKEPDYITAIIDIVVPVVERFAPGLILVSAGYDSHFSDCMSSLGLTAISYRKIMIAISALGQWLCQGRIGIVLEGGYDYVSTSESVLETLYGCMGISELGEIKDRQGLEDYLVSEGGYSSEKVRNWQTLEKIKDLFMVGG